jgi:2-polyprenyl-3-methyl-5-hydroxy-6-metoxy-1,4-benzoquinol methylase
MKTREKYFIAKDHLVSSKEFKIVWNKEKQMAQTLIPEGTSLSSYYNSERYHSHKNKNTSNKDRIYSFVQNLMFRFKRHLIKRYSTGSKLLDYGTGVGNFSKFMIDNGFNVLAIEPDKQAMKASISKSVDTVSHLKMLSDKERFNTITLWHVLEHIPDPYKIITELKLHLDKKGIMFIAVPNLNSHDCLYYKSNWAALDVPRHVWHFTSPGIQMLMQKAGFELVKRHPLWFDALYISYLSEDYLGNRWPLLKGFFIGLTFNIKAFFSGEYSSIIYVFRKT